MLRLFYGILLTTTITISSAQNTDDFQQNINEMSHYKAILANDDDFDNIENKLVVDISGGIKNVKINEKKVDSLGFTRVISTFLSTNNNKKSLLIAGSFDHATMDNIVVFSRIFNQCKTLFDPNNKSKIYFKSFKDAAFSSKGNGNIGGQ